MRIILVLIILSGLNIQLKAQNLTTDQHKKHWVDSVYNALNQQERIAQTIMIRAYSNKSSGYNQNLINSIKKHQPGGVCFFQGGPIRHNKLLNEINGVVNIPLLTSMDAEWGPAMRLDSIEAFPRQMMLGAIENDSLIYQMGVEIGRQLNLLGINMNFAPVIDVNSNPSNPVINSRSFGQSTENVSRKGIAYIKGLQKAGVIAVAKHFPGHGDTDKDSHKTLPLVSLGKNEIMSTHIAPFQQAIKESVGGIMVAHLNVPALDPTNKLPSTLSSKIINDLLIEQMNFKGLIITDALEMKGIANYTKPGQAEIDALRAGNDIILLPQDLELAIKHVDKAINNNSLSARLLEFKVKKILEFKYDYALSNKSLIIDSTLIPLLNSTTAATLKQQLFNEAITIVKNQNNLIPFKKIDTLNIACISVGKKLTNPIGKQLNNYKKIKTLRLNSLPSYQQIDLIKKKIKDQNLIIISVYGLSQYPGNNYKMNQKIVDFINDIALTKKVVVIINGNPYILKRFGQAENIASLIVSYHPEDQADHAIAQILFGGRPALGSLPVNASKHFPMRTGFKTKKIRLGYTDPSHLGIDNEELAHIDSIVISGIHQLAYPGSQVLLAKDGNIFYHKSFGNHTYVSQRIIKNTDLFDLASITKIATTTLLLMRLSEEGKIDIDQNLGYYLSYLKNTDKANLLIRDVLTHQARLHPWIPFYIHSLDTLGNPDKQYYSKTQKKSYLKVVDDLYINEFYKDTILQRIIDSELRPRKKYKYSDLGLILLKEIIELQSGTSLDKLADSLFYQPLGLSRITFNPLQKFNKMQIAPTEDDVVFRKQLIHGYVHDPCAAMMGGVEGHAGLFSNAMDLAAIMQMLLDKGYYGGHRYLKGSTINEFSKQQFPLNKNRRGLGFDKPLPNDEEGGPACIAASDQSFGHSGFTGTYAWADPANGLIFIFLSNRIHPIQENKKLIRLDIRTKIHQAAYDALKD